MCDLIVCMSTETVLILSCSIACLPPVLDDLSRLGNSLESTWLQPPGAAQRSTARGDSLTVAAKWLFASEPTIRLDFLEPKSSHNLQAQTAAAVAIGRALVAVGPTLGQLAATDNKSFVPLGTALSLSWPEIDFWTEISIPIGGFIFPLRPPSN